jgi:hypothetical protein
MTRVLLKRVSMMVLPVFCALTLAGPNALALQGKYFIAQPMSYDYDRGCGISSNVGDYAYAIRAGLNGLGWTGRFYTGANVRARAWTDHSRHSLGWDHLDDPNNGFNGGADLADVAVFTGHGNTGRILLGAADSYAGETLCHAGANDSRTNSNILLGAGYGAHLASTVIIACCYMNTRFQNLLYADHWEKQVMGFGGTAKLEGSMVTNYLNGTGGSSNVDSWLNNMEDRPGWWTGDNSTVVMTTGNTVDEVNWNRWYCGLKRQNCVNGGPGGFLVYLDQHDHGCGGCWGC